MSTFVKFPPTSLPEAIDVIDQDAEILHEVVHGDDTTEVLTENGLIPSIAKWQKDNAGGGSGGGYLKVEAGDPLQLDVINIIVSGTSFSLPDTTSLVNGSTLEIQSEASIPPVITTFGAELITSSSGTTSELILNTHNRISFTWDGVTWKAQLSTLDNVFGPEGKSAYEVAVENGFVGTESEWLNSLVGEQGLQGVAGINGANGQDGKSAYEVAVDNGFIGTESEWLESLVGEQGVQGTQGEKGDKGDTGAGLTILGELTDPSELPLTGVEGDAYLINGDLYVWVETTWQNVGNIQGPQGKSAYEVAVDEGFIGTETQWLESLVGEQGIQGDSAYDVAVANGFTGTESDWLLSLKGVQGDEGLSAYEVALSNGFVGTEAQWLESLEGDQGPAGSVTDQHNLLDGRDSADAHPASSISGLATVATSGQFTDLVDASGIQQQINSARILALAGL